MLFADKIIAFRGPFVNLFSAVKQPASALDNTVGYFYNKDHGTEFIRDHRTVAGVVRKKQTEPTMAAGQTALPRLGLGDHAATDADRGGNKLLRAFHGRTA